jgi:hypothetical protein
MLLKPIKSQSTDIITHDALSKTLRQWSIYLEIPYDTLRMRYRRGLKGDELFKQKQPYEKSGAYARSLS